MTGPERGNLFEGLPAALAAERFDCLLEAPGIRVERIVSTGHRTPDGEWWDQERDEWVALLQGAAALRFDDHPEPVTLRPGDWLFIRAHRRHRVDWTGTGEPTVWLAVHVARDPGAAVPAR
jgi:cupin 2 domain-containing protein